MELKEWPSRYQMNVKAKTLGRQYLPDRKRSADVIDCGAEYTEREAAANKRKQHCRFHAVDRLLVDVKLASEVGHGNSRCITLPPLRHQSYVVMSIGAVTWGTQKARPLGNHTFMRLAVQLLRSHMTVSDGSDTSIDGRGESSDHRRQQRDWP